ncbi:hypothetical protein OG799_04165 [Micromonospora sp. NBC_00898]|uniref:hypothetical protein n=1 Tax=Micromonospora sp. NBC_00898 TaxID=2975981 RepID=UPI00386756E2|nr:hypothetical protein OG799_04165 [Micromonospora sp. NBC_00898]
MDEDWELRYVRIRKGAHRSKSAKSPGFESDLLREDGTNKLLGPTESIPVDPDELVRLRARGRDPKGSARAVDLSPAQQAFVDAISPLLRDAIERLGREVVAPVVEEIVIPATRRALSKIGRKLRAKVGSRQAAAGDVDTHAATAEQVVLNAPSSADSSRATGAELEEPGISMSTAEFLQRFMAAEVAEQFAAEQRRILSRALRKNDDLAPELESSIKLILAGKSSLLDDEALTEVMNFLQQVRVVDGAPMPLRKGETKKPPRLRGGEA